MNECKIIYLDMGVMFLYDLLTPASSHHALQQTVAAHT